MLTIPTLLLVLGAAAVAAVSAALTVSSWWWTAAAPLLLLLLTALHDVLQRRHSLLRNYPVLGHLRFALEALRPEIQQYFIERNFDGRPFGRDTRSLVYERAKGTDAEEPFGSERDLYEAGSEYLTPSMAPRPLSAGTPRVRVGGPDCTQPYDMALLNISAMSFGSLSANAILALNTGAQQGGFAHDTGEGGLSDHHLRPGGDLVWEIGTGYFGCRTDDGGFDEREFARKAAHPHVKAVSLKISQGAKPGVGGVLPGAKVNAEIARVRGVPQGRTVVSPPYHRVYTTPRELVRFLARMRELADGKPVGFKLCVGSRREFLAVCRAALTGLRDRIRVGAAGKVATGGDLVKRLLQGADYTNAARAMMFAVGCIQAQRCHTNTCPVGVAIQSERRARALGVGDKAQRVRRYQEATVRSAREIMAAMGIEDPRALRPHMLLQRVDPHTVRSYAELHEWLSPGQLLASPPESWAADWAAADPDRFTPEPLPHRRSTWHAPSPGSSSTHSRNWASGTSSASSGTR
ncbi:FMN-binding glutamate synthase family protein [Streptomyces erythrochromogenes]|uniref:FMN-binding glutamate synthase family protein n=1 Tax=Streptomyces erythrochromogenes TaxID=285574 RepID=UPI00367BF4E8